MLFFAQMRPDKTALYAMPEQIRKGMVIYMFDKILTIALNPSLDVTLWIDSVDFSEPNRCGREKTYAGGKSLNVTRVLKNLGVASCCFCIAGQDNAGMLTSLLHADGVHCRLISVPGVIRENMSIVFPDGRLLKINRKGAPVGGEALRELAGLIRQELSDTSHALILFAGSLPPDLSPAQYKDFIFSFQSESVRIAIDSDIFSAADLAQLRPFLIKPNFVEARNLLGQPEADEAALLEGMRRLSGQVEHILLSMGKEGIAYLHGGQLTRIRVPQVPVKSTVGAGDTTLAGFLAAVEQGLDPVACARYAACCGTASVTLDGTEAITPELVTPYLNQAVVV